MKGGYGLVSHKIAKFWKAYPRIKAAVKCELCPKYCIIPQNQKGFCRARKNEGGKLYTLVYGRPISVAIDPIEKKPLFHFLPGTKAYSFGVAGCNLSCIHCQNWEISQADPEYSYNLILEPEDIIKDIEAQKDANIKSIAYTYTEPTIFIEYVIDTAKLAHRHGLKNNFHTNGFINEEPLKEVSRFMDAANIDIKYFSNDIYMKNSQATLQPILDAITILYKKGIWIELTHLIIPGINDSKRMTKQLCRWIVDNVGQDVPLHISRFYPAYKLSMVPPTDIKALEDAVHIAEKEGIKFVYIGNIPHEKENTFCPSCKEMIVQRRGFHLGTINIKNGRCGFCAEKIPGVWG